MIDVEAFRKVYNELIEYPVFAGCYDAENGDEHYMNGINTIMSVIASHAGYLDEFENMFDFNMQESRDRKNK